MSTQSKGEPTPEPVPEPTPESEKEEKTTAKIYYCELCKIPCMSSMTLQTHFAGIRHKKRERLLQAIRDPVIYEPQSVKRPLSTSVRSLKDFMKDPEREEPLVGLEYVVEIRFIGKKEPSYECQLCEFNTELVPMIEHLTGQRHRKSYLTKHYPEKARRYPNEDKARFLRRVAREVEKEEGLKTYKRERYERPSVPSATAAKKKAKIGYKRKNDPIRRRKALKYMSTFKITSDTEATLVINIAQSLSEALRTFCEKKAALVHIRSLPSLVPPGKRNTKQVSKCEPTKPFKQGDKNWNIGHLSNGVAQLKSLLQQTSSISHTPTNSYGSQMGRRVSSSGVSSKDRATMSALQSSFAPQPEGAGCGINEWMKQFNQSASVYFQSTSAGEKSPYFTSPQSSYPTQHHQGNSTKVPSNRMADRGLRNWENRRESRDSRAYPDLDTPISYPLPRRYQANYPSQGFHTWYDDGSVSGNEVSVSFSSESKTAGWPQQSGYQQSNFRGEVGSYPSFSGNNSCNDYQKQNTQLSNLISGSNTGLTANIMNQLRGKDVTTLTDMLQQLVPHYPDLQKIDIYALAQALSEMN